MKKSLILVSMIILLSIFGMSNPIIPLDIELHLVHPSYGSTDVLPDTEIRWYFDISGGGISEYDEYFVYFEVYFGLDSDDLHLIEFTDSDSYKLEKLDYGMKYYWKIVAKIDFYKGETIVYESPVSCFETISLEGIFAPDNPKPSDDEHNVSINPTLRWECSNPKRESMTYDIYFGTSPNPPLVKENHDKNTYDPGELEYGTKYYWKIVVKDKKGNVTEGPIWSFDTVNHNEESLKWAFETESNLNSSPAIGKDGTIYVGSGDNFLYALTPEGQLKWKYETGDSIFSSPAIGEDGTIYVGSGDNFLYALTPEGQLKWKYETGDSILSSPAVRKDGVIYVGSTDNYLYAITQDGHLKWKYETGDGIFSSPAIGEDGTVYVGSLDNHLYAITFYGHLKWKYKTGDSVFSSPAISKNGTVYVGSNDNYIHAVSIEGKLKWKYETGDSILSSPVIGEDGAIYVGSGDNHLYAFGIGGFLKWKYETGWRIYSNPAIGSDGIIYIGSWDNNVYAISSDGELQWKFNTDDLVRSSPTIGMDGTIYVGSWDNHIYAIRSSSTGPANSSWPKFRKVIKNSGSLCEKIPNMLPDIQSNPYPPNNAKGININPVLKWECNDLDGDRLTYDIYIGRNENPSLIKIEYTGKIYSPGPLSYNTTYYWKIVAIDEKGGITEGPLWKLTTKEGSSTEGMVLVEGGTFQMGDTWGDGESDEKPVHEVNLTYDFYMGKYEVTFEEYDEYCEYTGKTKQKDKGWGRGKHPVIYVSWYDAIEYCNWLSEQEGLAKAYDENGNLLNKWGNVTTDITKVQGYRLPTEAEWEYAARGGNESNGYKYSGSNDPDEVAWYLSNSGGQSHEVGTKESNELGIYDMSGNVYEWCQDWYDRDYYEISPDTNPYNHESDSSRVLRSGSWCRLKSFESVANRYFYKPEEMDSIYGFRVCRTAY